VLPRAVARVPRTWHRQQLLDQPRQFAIVDDLAVQVEQCRDVVPVDAARRLGMRR